MGTVMKLLSPPLPERASLRDIHKHRHTIGLRYPQLGLIGVLSVLAALCQAALLLIIVRVATALTTGSEQVGGVIGPLAANGLSTPWLLWLGTAILVALFVVELAGAWAHARLYARSQRDTQRFVLSSYSAASFEAQTSTSRGDTQQLLHVHAGQAAGLVNALSAGVTSLTNFGVLVISALVLSPFAAIVVLFGLSMMLVALRPLIRSSKRLSEERASKQRLMASLLSDRLELNREIRTFGVESTSNQPIEAHVDEVADVFARLRLVSKMTSVSYRLGAFALIICMLAVMNASNATGMAALTGALLMLLRSLSYGQATQAAIQAINEAVPIVDQLIVEATRFHESTLAIGTDRTRSASLNSVELSNVGFGYQRATDQSAVLDKIDLRVDHGEFVALVGPSGSGKSTLMSLLLGLRPPSSGHVLVNGHPLNDIDPDWWHQRVGYVAQDPRLSSGTVLDAIKFGRPHVTTDDAIRAAQQAHIADEIEQWPHSWETPVGALGDQLSGGQRQRLALARALAGDPDLLLLDEPTSALDTRSEGLIGQTLDELRGDVTIVAIAHRLETINNADRIHRVVDGRVEPYERPVSIGADT